MQCPFLNDFVLQVNLTGPSEIWDCFCYTLKTGQDDMLLSRGAATIENPEMPEIWFIKTNIKCCSAVAIQI